jgi:uncharacterized LabA/DUF88 family protein
MCNEPAVKRTVAFFDGQNLFHHAREAFGYDYPSYSPLSLASQICKAEGFNLLAIHFYTGIPSQTDDPFWNSFWAAKLLAMSRAGIKTFSRSLRYRKKRVKIREGIELSTLVGEEKGIDVRIALDVIRMVRKNDLDVVLLFSQDQDFSEVADEEDNRQRTEAVDQDCISLSRKPFRNESQRSKQHRLEKNRSGHIRCLS